MIGKKDIIEKGKITRKILCNECGFEYELTVTGDKVYKFDELTGLYYEVTKDGEPVGYKKK